MPHEGLIVPAETSVLCEGCGYTLDGLPTTGQCPECGLPIDQSTAGDGRHLPDWEDPAAVTPGKFRRFLRTTAAVLFAPKRFYRTLATRRQNEAALRFARVHWLISAILFAAALAIHANWYQRTLGLLEFLPDPKVVFAIAIPLIYLLLWSVTRLAARLSAWEAVYWGYRLPLPVVQRSLYYHAAHYLPVAILSLATIAANAWLARHRLLGPQRTMRYLDVLCAEVLRGAGYLFKTYWAGMKNTMWANR
jgi:hypothetical protein